MFDASFGGAFYLVGDRLIEGDINVFKNYENTGLQGGACGFRFRKRPSKRP